MEDSKKNAALGVGAVLAALGASLCCILPVAVAILGVGSAALGAKVEFLRPWLAVLTIVILGVAHYQAYKPVECAPGDACAVPANRRRHRILLLMVTILAIVLMAFPYYISWLI
jgi:mercuric ion transport protein